jgi:small-conductance mechanosensitive channel
LAERAKDIFASAWLSASRAWNHELFSIEDAMETADGRKLTVARSVTIGKSFGAVLILVAGYFIASFVVRWIERRIVAAHRSTAQAAALARKWILFVLTAILAIFALFSASIPLTAFAFLGGALAIAAGFGLQTLLKNLVSGVMLLVERPLRLGDLVEVDSLRGRITEIGLRASTIRSGDGTESMVPNSRFLEGNMTNWTYSSPTHRQTITLGVAYGSPLRRVSEILSDVLTRHGLVLKVPAPQVYLDAYGDSSINFALNYWIEMTEQMDPRRVKSDLLHMIDRAFEEADIRIPYSQREVRVSTVAPASVTVLPPAAGRAAP